MIKKILVAYDGSEESNSAFNFALDLVKKYKAQLHVLSVIELPQPPEDVETEAILEHSRNKYEHLFKELRKEGREIEFHTSIVNGHPANCIVDTALEKSIDVIVMGHQTHTGFGRWFLGSTANRVIDHAECSVIVVKKDHDIKKG